MTGSFARIHGNFNSMKLSEKAHKSYTKNFKSALYFQVEADYYIKIFPVGWHISYWIDPIRS